MIPKYVSYSIDPLYELELRLVTMLAGLHTQTGLHCLIIQVKIVFAVYLYVLNIFD